MSTLEKYTTLIEEFLILALVLSSVAVVFVNIVLRYLFSKGFVFAEEYARYALVLLVYISVSQAIKKNRMIKVEIITEMFTGSKFALTLVSNGFSFVMGVLLIVFGWQFTLYQYQTGQASIAMRLPMYLAHAIVPFGGLLMCVRYAVSTHQTIRGRRAGKTHPSLE
jgi:TRAP-type C4-dicarboxylate transport system permease small subunit